jgi:hypothetical protein
MGNIPLPALSIRPPEQQQDPAENYVRLKSLLGQQQVQQQQIQAGQLENQQRQIDLNSQKALQKAYMEAQGDPDKTTKLAAQYGAKPQALLQWQSTVMDQKMKTLQLVQQQGSLAKTQADLMQGAHDQVAATGPQDRPAVYQQQRTQLGQQGVDVSQLPPQYPGDEAFRFMGVAVKSHTQQVEDALKSAEMSKDVSQGQEAAANAKKTQVVVAGMSPSGITAEQQATLAQGQKRLVVEGANLIIARGRLAEEQRHNQATEGQLTPEALDMAAQQFASTGQMPNVGRSGAVRAQIINQAATKYPKVDLATNAAAYKANQDSLQKLQSNLDSVTAFESTANKNLDLFLDQAKKVVDSGSPFLNTPLRMINQKMLGSSDQAAYSAARQVAVNEIAKVTSNPGLSGQLSDSARHEIDTFNPQNATLGQTYKVAQVLRQDMANRHESYSEQISAIKQRLGNSTTGGNAPGGGSSGLTVTAPNGKTYNFKDQASADAFRKAAGIQ